MRFYIQESGPFATVGAKVSVIVSQGAVTYPARAIGASSRRWTIEVEDRKPFPVDAATVTTAELVARFIVRGMRRAGPIIRMVRDDGKAWIPRPDR